MVKHIELVKLHDRVEFDRWLCFLVRAQPDESARNQIQIQAKLENRKSIISINAQKSKRYKNKKSLSNY
jgi:hypothetical protein